MTNDKPVQLHTNPPAAVVDTPPEKPAATRNTYGATQLRALLQLVLKELPSRVAECIDPLLLAHLKNAAEGDVIDQEQIIRSQRFILCCMLDQMHQDTYRIRAETMAALPNHAQIEVDHEPATGDYIYRLKKEN